MNEPSSPPTLWILWGAIFASQVLCAGLGASGLFHGPPPEGVAFLPVLFTAVAVAAALLAHVLWLRTRGSGPGPAGGPGGGGASPSPGTGATGGPAVFPMALAAWALDEGISILGLVLAILGFPFSTWILFPAAGLTLALLHAPRART